MSTKTLATIHSVWQTGLAGLDFESGAADLRTAYADSWRLLNNVMFEQNHAAQRQPRLAMERLFAAWHTTEQRDFAAFALLGRWHRQLGTMATEVLFLPIEDNYYDKIVEARLAAACRAVDFERPSHLTASVLLDYASSVILTELYSRGTDRLSPSQQMQGVIQIMDTAI